MRSTKPSPYAGSHASRHPVSSLPPWRKAIEVVTVQLWLYLESLDSLVPLKSGWGTEVVLILLDGVIWQQTKVNVRSKHIRKDTSALDIADHSTLLMHLQILAGEDGVALFCQRSQGLLCGALQEFFMFIVHVRLL